MRGVLFTGPPGTGKTMMARIIANSSQASFYDIGGPEILSKWVGQSEEILRKIFQDAATQDKSVIFFDEIDSIASSRDQATSESSRRIVTQLLTLIDGFSPLKNILIIATTNRPQDLDQALLRPGRFDWHIPFTLPNLSDRHHILESYKGKTPTRGPIQTSEIANITESWSPADLSAIWREAASLAASDERGEIMMEDLREGHLKVHTFKQQMIANKR